MKIVVHVFSLTTNINPKEHEQMCTIVQCALLHSVQYCTVYTIAQYALLHSVHYCTVCTIAWCALLYNVHYCTVCTIVQCALLYNVHNWCISQQQGAPTQRTVSTCSEFVRESIIHSHAITLVICQALSYNSL